MERESFERAEVAKLLTKSYISIKVDKEERPDIDAVYMNVCQMLTGSGGWPLTIIMTPEQKPFFAGTYFPMRTQYGRMGLLDLLPQISKNWKENKQHLIGSSEKIYNYLIEQSKESKIQQSPTKQLLKKAELQFQDNYDHQFGGFSTAPKFPIPHNLLFLLRYGILENKQYCLEMATDTLMKMYQGGIYDHIGGGFSRYSTDEKWLVPHFEKMLYDNALLIYVYLEGYQLTNQPLFKKVAKETISYVINELMEDTNGFYCGQDADSEGEEGKFYTFTKQEVLKILGKDAGETFCKRYNITQEGNFEGKNIVNLGNRYKMKLEQNKADSNLDFNIKSELNGIEFELDNMKQKLYEYRKQRTILHKDDKILTSWNAMMIASLSKASLILEDSSYLTLAVKSETFITNQLMKDGFKLFIRYRKGHVANEGHLDDYAYYAWALLELYAVTFDLSYLEKAVKIADRMIESFWDEEWGGFYLYAKESEQLITRPKETYDGAIPSGNSVVALVLAKLFLLTAEEKWRSYQIKQFAFLSKNASNYPMAYSFALIAFLNTLYPSTEIICISKQEFDIGSFLKLLKKYPKKQCVAIIKTKPNESVLSKIAPFTKEYPFPESGQVYYVCENGVCKAPVKDINELKSILQK